MRRADEEIERDFALTQDDLDRSRALDRDAVLQKMDRRMAHIAVQQRAWYEANRDKVAAQKRAWYEANRDKVAAQQRAYREANRDKVAAQKRAWYEANRDKVAAKQLAYREANRLKSAQKNPPADNADKGEG